MAMKKTGFLSDITTHKQIVRLKNQQIFNIKGSL